MRTIPLKSVILRFASAAMCVLIAFAGASPVTAQETSCKIRTVIANVSDSDGKLVQGLSAKDFQAKFRGKPVTIRSAVVNEQRRQVLVLLNMRGSMRGFYQKTGLLDAPMVHVLIGQNPANSRFALATYGLDYQTIVPFTIDPQVIVNRILTLKIDTPQIGDPRLSKIMALQSLWGAVVEGLQTFQPPGRGDVIFAVTNGGAGRGEKGLEQAKELLWEKGVRLFALIVSASDFRPLDNEGPHDLDQVARQTGGDSLFSKVGAPFSDGSKPSRSDLVLLEEGLRRVNNEIDNFYELEIELPDDISKTSEWDLKLVDQKDAKQRKIMVSYPREILPCNPSK